MASKAGQPEADKVDIEEALDYVDKTLDRTKVLYEQYFLGMQKQPPTQIHTDVERRLRDLQQLSIRNTGLRYRFATLQQKFGSYNSYWRRTLKQIENGTYIRNLQKISRKAAMTGEAIPEEILAAMPKRMREQVKRDREQALAIAKRRHDTHGEASDFDDGAAAVIGEAPEVARHIPRGGAQLLDESDGDLDFEAFFASVDKADDTQPNAPAYQEPAAPPPRATAPPPPPAASPSAVGGPQYPRSATQPGTPGSARPGPPPLPQRATGPVPSIPGQRVTQPMQRATGAIPVDPTQRASGPIPVDASGPIRVELATGAVPTMPGDPTQRPSGGIPTQRATGPVPTQRATGPVPAMPGNPAQRPSGGIPTQRATGPVPAQRATGPVPLVPPPAGSAMDRAGVPASRITGPVPLVPPPAGSAMDRSGVPASRITGPVPAVPRPGVPNIPRPGAPSQVSKPNPIAPGSSTARPSVPVETMSGPFPRAAAPPVNARPEPAKVAQPKPQATTPRPPPGMNDADVNALYATYVKAKQAVGEEAGPGSYGKLLQTINAQAPKIMEQYKAKGVEFSVVVKDNQVVIKAKPKP